MIFSFASSRMIIILHFNCSKIIFKCGTQKTQVLVAVNDKFLALLNQGLEDIVFTFSILYKFI